MKSTRSKACDIPTRVKRAVWERDNFCCIYCGSTRAMPNALSYSAFAIDKYICIVKEPPDLIA